MFKGNRPLIVHVKSHGADYDKGQKCAWDDVYFRYRIGRETRRIAPCIIGKLDREWYRPLIKKDPRLWSFEARMLKLCKVAFDRKNLKPYFPFIIVDTKVDRRKGYRIPNVCIPEKYVTKAVVERVARGLIFIYDEYVGPMKFRYR